MSIIKYLPTRIFNEGIELIKISPTNDIEKLNNLLILYKKNKKHLIYWHHNFDELIFNDIEDIKRHLKKNNLMCYCIYISDKMVGCIEVGRLSTDYDGLKYRILTYWIDKNNIRKGIMYKILIKLEKIFNKQKINYIKTEIDVNNEPSIKLMEKLNYKLFCISFQISNSGKTLCHSGSYKKILKKTVYGHTAHNKR